MGRPAIMNQIDPPSGFVLPQARNEARLKFLLCVVLALLSGLPFVPALDGGWVFDDTVLIANNRLIHSFEHASQWFEGQLFNAPISTVRLAQIRPFYRPLVVASYAVDYKWGDGGAWAFHVTNTMLHASVIVLVFRAAQRWGASLAAGAIVALLFAWHPTRTESVAWISGRPDLMVTLFLLLALEFHSWRRQRPVMSWTATLLMTAAAFLSKESAVLLPVFVWVESYCALGSPPLDRRSSWMSLRSSLWAWVAALGYVSIRASFLSLAPPREAFPMGTHLQLVLETCGRLIELAVFPRDLTLFASRISTACGGICFNMGYLVLGGSVLTGTVLLCVVLIGQRHREEARRRLALIVLLVACVFPVSQVVPIGITVMTQARFLYLPLLPLLVVLASFLPRFRPWIGGAAAGIAAACAGLSWQRSLVYASERTFWKAELAANPTVPEVIQAQLGGDVIFGGSQLAMRRAVCGFSKSQVAYSSRQSTSFLERAFDLGLATVPDGSPSLLIAANFIGTVLEGQAATYSDRFVVEAGQNSTAARTIRSQEPVWRMRQAALTARHGEVDRAFTLVERSVRGCGACDDVAYQAAQVAVLYGQPDSAQRYARDLGREVQQRLAAVTSLIDSSRAAMGLNAAFELSGVGRILNDPTLSYRAVLPYAESIENGAPEDIRMTWALISGQAGDLERALSIRERLSSDARRRLDELGFPKPISDRNSAFVPGTCALPSEL